MCIFRIIYPRENIFELRSKCPIRRRKIAATVKTLLFWRGLCLVATEYLVSIGWAWRIGPDKLGMDPWSLIKLRNFWLSKLFCYCVPLAEDLENQPVYKQPTGFWKRWKEKTSTFNSYDSMKTALTRDYLIVWCMERFQPSTERRRHSHP